MSQKGLTFKIFIFLVLNDFLETAAHMSFKKAASTQENLHISHGQDILIFTAHMLSSPFLWLGLLTVALIFTSWSTILSKIDLSIATPVASFSCVLVTLAGWLFFAEYISLLRWTGVFLILGGVSLVSTSSSSTKT